MTTTTAATTVLLATLRDGSYCVRDADGGVWWPSAEAEEAILAAESPKDEAVRICSDEPMRGTWHS